MNEGETRKEVSDKKMDMWMVAALGIVAIMLLGGFALTESWELIILVALGAVIVTKVL